MPLNFATLFDRKYALRAIALYFSTQAKCSSFSFWMLCLDEESHTLLTKLALPGAIVLSIADLKDRALENVRSSRTGAEFAWTAKSSLMRYIMGQIPPNEGITYLDADLFLFSDPTPFYKSLSSASIAITPHRFSPPDKERERKVGSNNAGWIFLRNDAVGRACLEHWYAQCIEWCFNRKEPHRYGDQIYLDEWPTLYPRVATIDRRGVNMGPWNMGGKTVSYKENVYSVDGIPLIWYHFHAFNMYLNAHGKLKGYPVSMPFPMLYNPYLAALNNALAHIRKVTTDFDIFADPHPGAFRVLKQTLFRFLD